MALQARSQNRRVLLGSQPIPAATRQSLGTSQRGFFVHLPPNSLNDRDHYVLQWMRYVKAIVPIGLGLAEWYSVRSATLLSKELLHWP